MRKTFLESITDEPEQEEEDRYTLRYYGGNVLGTVEISVKQFDIDVTWSYRIRGDIDIYSTEVHRSGINATLRDDDTFEPLAKQIFKDISRHFNNMKFKRSSDLSPRIKEVMKSIGILLEGVNESITDEPDEEEESYKLDDTYDRERTIKSFEKIIKYLENKYSKYNLNGRIYGFEKSNEDKVKPYFYDVKGIDGELHHGMLVMFKGDIHGIVSQLRKELYGMGMTYFRNFSSTHDSLGFSNVYWNEGFDLIKESITDEPEQEEEESIRWKKMLPVNEMITPSVQIGGNMTPASPDSYVGKPVKTCPKCYGEGCKKCKGTGRLTEEFWNTFIVSRSMGRTEVPVFRNPTKSETETDFRQVSYDRGILDKKGVLYAWSGQLDALHEDMSHRMRIPLGAREGMSVDEMNLGLYMMPLEGLVEVSLYKTQIDKRDLAWAKKELVTRVKSNKNIKKYMGGEFKVGFTFSHYKSRYGTGLGESKPFTNYLKEDEPEEEELAPEEKGIRVGSRVKALHGVGNNLRQNQIGTVLWIGPNSKYGSVRQVGVEFDNDINGHDLFGAIGCPVKGKNHHCWFVNDESLKLIQGTGQKPKKLSLEDQIDYLELFIVEWDKATDKGDKQHEKDLIEQYEIFTKINGLPKISADELLDELRQRNK